MNPKNIDNKLVVIYHHKSNKPLGTGFFVTEFGHFVTSYHVVKDFFSIREELRCWCKGDKYRIKYIETLSESNFYSFLKAGKIRIDLIILQIDFTKINLKTDYFPIINFDVSNNLSELHNVFYRGFFIKNAKNVTDAEIRSVKVDLSRYEERNDTWVIRSDDEIHKGFSGSPVIFASNHEVLAVLVHSGSDEKKWGAIQSLHMLTSQIESYDNDLYNLIVSSDLLYRKYHVSQSTSFEREDWPYAIDQEAFVNTFNFDIYTFSARPKKRLIESEKCIPFIVQQLKEHPVFCVGYYGMGKTTISKFLFRNYFSYSTTEYPIFVSLSNVNLSEITLQSLNNLIANRIFSELSEGISLGTTSSVESMILSRERVQKFIDNNVLMLILDGIDEAVYDRRSLMKFCEFLKSLKCSFFLTSRKEFYAFFDVFKYEMRSHDHLVIELLPWHQKQWLGYVGNLRKKYPGKSPNINRFEGALYADAYGELPKRPLFLKMISDLELDERTNLRIPSKLRSNRSAMYNYYIKWKIEDDYDRKGAINIIDKGYFKQDSFILFRKLANVEYSKTIPSDGAVGLLKQNIELNKNYSYIFAGFSLKDIEEACENLEYLKIGLVREHLLNSTFFSTMKRLDGGNLFKFSHKSFCEYLVAFNLAHTIFGGTTKEAKCGHAWHFYQTHEVSSHFQDEIERICYVNQLSVETRNQYLQEAFEKVLLKQDHLENYSEQVEEVLYYTGKYRIDSPRILAILKRMIEDPTKIHPIYYRTAHISLSLITSADYCLRYVEYLANCYDNDGKAFLLNSDIQLNYYGKTNLYVALRKKIDEFIRTGELKEIVPLEIFSYFTCLPFEDIEIGSARRYLNKIRGVCDKKNLLGMRSILDKTLSIVEKNSNRNKR